MENWLEEVLGCTVWIGQDMEQMFDEVEDALSLMLCSTGKQDDLALMIPSNNTFHQRDKDLLTIHAFLNNMTFPLNVPQSEQICLSKCACQFLVRGQQLWRKESSGRHQLVLFNTDRL